MRTGAHPSAPPRNERPTNGWQTGNKTRPDRVTETEAAQIADLRRHLEVFADCCDAPGGEDA